MATPCDGGIRFRLGRGVCSVWLVKRKHIKHVGKKATKHKAYESAA